MRGIISGTAGILTTPADRRGLAPRTTDPDTDAATAAAAMALSKRDEELIAEVSANVGTRLDSDYVVHSVRFGLGCFGSSLSLTSVA